MTPDTGKRSGQLCIGSMRIPERVIPGYLASEMGFSEVLNFFPDSTENGIPALLAFVTDQGKGRQNIPNKA